METSRFLPLQNIPSFAAPCARGSEQSYAGDAT
jgi:hypothetical protein